MIERRVFKDSTGRIVYPVDTIFPILSGDPETQEFEFVATGFFIHAGGGFVTAKHVMLDNDGKPTKPFFAVQTIEGKEHVIRRIGHWSQSNISDICVGLLVPQQYTREMGWQPREIRAVPLTLNLSQLSINDEIKTFAYPLSKISNRDGEQWGEFEGKWINGVIEDHFPKGRDTVLLPGPCYQTSMTILGGASGGPVIKDGGVVGINSTGYDGTQLSYITPITEVLELNVLYKKGTISIKELIEMKHIPVM
jgi:hypothetical protein